MSERWTPKQVIALARLEMHQGIKAGHAEYAATKARELYRLLLMNKDI